MAPFRFLAIILTLLATSLPLRAEQITVAVASNFLTTAQDITAAFSAETGHEVALVHGSTGKLFAQIVSGAPYDLFLSADSARPTRLVENGSATADSQRAYAIGRLAFVHGAGTEPGELDEMLIRPLRLAIADPAIAPYGVAARDVLRAFRGGDWARRTVIGESVGQAFAFVATGNADAGFVGLAQARTYEGKIWVLEIPGTFHDPIQQDAVLLTRAADNPVAIAFLDFLSSDFAHQILIASGYEIPQ